jgi:hypothetical protein
MVDNADNFLNSFKINNSYLFSGWQSKSFYAVNINTNLSIQAGDTYIKISHFTVVIIHSV